MEEKKEWIYEPNFYCEHREILGYKGEKTLIVVGVNPSTAEPNCLDPTLKSVERITKNNGFDSFIMFNLYPQRATDPNDLDVALNTTFKRLNEEAFEKILRSIKEPKIWLAYGNLVEKRSYLKDCLSSLIEIADRHNATYYCAGKISKKGHPHHPLYLKSDEKLKRLYVQ